MSVKCNKPPHCNWCNEAIRKATKSHCPNGNTVHVVDMKTPLFSKAECQRLTNETVMSVSYHRAPVSWNDEEQTHTPNGQPRAVDSFTTWDGESYADDLFCSNGCAMQFGRQAARRAAA